MISNLTNRLRLSTYLEILKELKILFLDEEIEEERTRIEKTFERLELDKTAYALETATLIQINGGFLCMK